MARAAGVTLLERLSLESIGPEGITARGEDGAVVELPCDTAALSLGVRPRRKVVEELSGLCEEVYCIGDCSTRQGNIASAVRDGFFAAMNV